MTRGRPRWRGAVALLCAAELTTPTIARGQAVSAAPVAAPQSTTTPTATTPTATTPTATSPPPDAAPPQPAAETAAPAAPESPPSPEPVPDQAAALAHFREGKAHYNERRYAEAAEAFSRSLEAAWSINAAYNKALSLDRASDLVAALAAYQYYLAHADENDEHRVTALERSEQLRQRVGEVLLQLDSPEAIREIRINGVEVDADDFPWLTLPGPLEVEFVGEAPGQRKDVRADVRAGGTVTIVFPGFVRPEVRPAEPPKLPGKAIQPGETRRHKALRAGFWTTTSLALAGGVTVAVLGSRVLWYGRRDATLCDPMCDAAETIERDEGRKAFSTLQDATNVAIAVSAALGVAAVALGVVLLRERSRARVSTRAGLRWLGSAVELTF